MSGRFFIVIGVVVGTRIAGRYHGHSLTRAFVVLMFATTSIDWLMSLVIGGSFLSLYIGRTFWVFNWYGYGLLCMITPPSNR